MLRSAGGTGEICLLGSFVVVDADGPIDLGGRQPRLLLAALLAHANEPVSIDALVDILLPAAPPPSAAKSVQVHVSRLRMAAVISTIPAGGEPIGVAVGSGFVWVANAARRTVDQIDPEGDILVRRIKVGGDLLGIAAASRGIWVVVGGND